MKLWLLILSTGAAGAVLFFLFLYSSAVSPLEERKETGAELASSTEDLQEINDISYFHGSDSYQVVDAVRADGESIYILTPEASPEQKEAASEPVVLLHSEGITPEEAEERVGNEEEIQEIHSVRLGIVENIPGYEINYSDTSGRLVYYYITFNEGEYMRSYQLGTSRTS